MNGFSDIEYRGPDILSYIADRRAQDNLLPPFESRIMFHQEYPDTGQQLVHPLQSTSLVMPEVMMKP